ncbi:protocadherin alpha-C2 isoform X1 [Xenopus tropicalis]|uniref:Protocadherin alpha subfamily C, 2 n=1 Tax=Xenopus tropicalis TaxID=8364 RepID=A0A803KB76_XENTR|nr:protocadherin alpha-C2 isoform X1 [Xenopus tropicalis]|eukprot:XP_004912839.1 PREDICTED: protocadherin alpha-C2 [Xenopus tropicalis]
MSGTRGCTVLRALRLLLVLSGWAAGQRRYSVREELSHGAFVGNVVSDLGLDLRLLPSRGFRIASGNSKQYFDVNIGNGVLFVNRTIDRETLCDPGPPCLINLEVVVGNPVEVHNIEVEILDINDNAPKFPRNEYYLEISESAVPGARFPIESAQDPDLGTNSIQTYKLSDNEYFALDLKTFNGNSKLIEIVLKKALDREQKPLHQLLLTAIDGGTPAKSGTAQVSVRVMDTNDNTPYFDKSTYKASVPENSPAGTLVIKLNAIDPDEGSNGDVLYSFSSYTPQKVRQLFTIDPQKGEIRINGAVDYEKASEYEIYVQATDKGTVPMAGHCKVLVEIVDVNDNAPEIVVTSNYSPVAENSHDETVVALMSVTDQDSGLNKQVSLRIQPNIPFKLTSFKNTYKLVTVGKLDREKSSSYNITVTVTDSGTPPLSTQKTLYVEVSDLNDNPPTFEEKSYSIYIMENNAPGVSLISVKATDLDSNENSFVSYSLLRGDIEGLPVSSYVSIKSDNGTIYAVHSFDYEKLREFHFVVQAQDAGNPSLSSSATVNIFIMDQNDHAPTILFPSTANGSASIEMIPRSANVGYLVAKVIAIDLDSGQNAWLFYNLSQASDPKLFQVELHTGEIRTTRKVVDDSITNYNLTILVRDNGQPSLSSSATISVVVVDRVPKTIPDTGRLIQNNTNLSEITIYLIIALCSISFVFLLTVIVLIIIKCFKCSESGGCCAGACGQRQPNPADIYKQANNNIETRLPPGLKVQPHFIEVRGNGSLTKTYCYKACLTAGSGSDTFMFYNTGAGPIVPATHVVATDRHVTAQNRHSVQNLIILKSETTTPVEPKHPHPDWRYSASLRAAMQGAVHMEGAAVLRGGAGGLEQQWPTVSSATPEPEGGEVSPPVGAGVNCNSWTFKYGPGNPKQPVPQIPPDFPENFIIPGSPAIISIRQDQPSAQNQKNFITFGKKEETKKKKKKKKGNKNQDKGNNSADNNDK